MIVKREEAQSTRDISSMVAPENTPRSMNTTGRQINHGQQSVPSVSAGPVSHRFVSLSIKF